MKKKCLANEDCPLARGYNAIGDWWSLLIVTRVVLAGMRRFNEIQDNLGMARNILTARLRKLVEHGILKKVPASDGSAFHEYAPTDKGRDLYKVIVALQQWGEAHFFAGGDCKYALVDRAKGELVPPMELRAADGRTLGPDDLAIAVLDGQRTTDNGQSTMRS